MEKLIIIKIGGEVLNNPERLNLCLIQVSKLKGKKILVHGGGRLLENLSNRLGVQQTMIQGRRITTKETLELATMVYAGAINKNIVVRLNQLSIAAIGLCGADCAVIPSLKRNPEPVDYGYVGDIVIDEINTKFISLLLSNNITPVFCSITYSQQDELLNSNADGVAASLAVAMSQYFETTLFYCFEKKGLLKNVNDNESVINKITKIEYKEMVKNNQITAGMMPKLETAFMALEMGVADVFITQEDNIINILNGEHFGTKIYI